MDTAVQVERATTAMMPPEAARAGLRQAGILQATPVASGASAGKSPGTVGMMARGLAGTNGEAEVMTAATNGRVGKRAWAADEAKLLENAKKAGS